MVYRPKNYNQENSKPEEETKQKADYTKYYSGSEADQKQHDDSIKQALDKGFSVYQGSEDRLLLDLYSREAFLRYKDNIGLLKKFYGIEEQESWISKSGKNTHVVLKLDKPLDVPTRIAIQTILGSDPKREIFSLAKARSGVKEPSLLFRPPS